MAYRLIFIAVCLFLFIAAAGSASAGIVGAEAWVTKADSMDLASSRTWQVLGHYKPQRNGWRSLIGDPNFFLVPDGRENPKAELNATIRGLFGSADLKSKHPLCRFPARVAWLIKTLQIPTSDLPTTPCNANKVLMDRIAPYEAVLVFPSAAFQGLGAMFGHTLVRIDAKDRSSIISYAVNYSALNEGTNTLKYVWKGLSGGFNGYYELMPYYRKLNEYKEMEERDIWEYHLNFDPDEVKMMALHALELRDIASEYYFLDENCSSNILFLFEAARPSLHLVDHYWDNVSFWVIPSDTVELLWSKGVLRKPDYRPSLVRQIVFLTKEVGSIVTEETTKLVNRQKRDDESPHSQLTTKEVGLSRELAAKVIQYRFSKLMMTQEDFQQQYGSLMKDNKQLLNVPVPMPFPPHEAHPAGRIETNLGYRRDLPFAEFGWRPAYHDITDIGSGYPDGGTLNFLDLKGRYYLTTGHFQLQKAEVLGFGSLSPVNNFFNPVSWSFHTGASQIYLHDGNEHFLGYLDVGAGRSFRSDAFGLVYWLIKGKVVGGGGGSLKENVDIGPGIELGINRRFSDSVQASIMAETTYFGVSEHGYSSQFVASFIQKINQNNSISIGETVHAVGWSKYVPETFLKWQVYF